MIDFKNATFFKLSPVDNHTFENLLRPMFVPGEEFIQSFKTIRDGVVFTTERIFAINIQGLTGKKKDFTSLPYSKIQTFSVETAGVLDNDSELDLWFSSLGRVRFEFVTNANVAEICRIISEKTMDRGNSRTTKKAEPARFEYASTERMEPMASRPVSPPSVTQRAKPIETVEPILSSNATHSSVAVTAPAAVLSLLFLFLGVPLAVVGLALFFFDYILPGALAFVIGVILLFVSYFNQ